MVTYFQNKVDKIVECDCLQFTAEVWKIEEDELVQNNNLTIIEDDFFHI